MTSVDLKELKELLAAGTPGPWDNLNGTIRAHVTPDLACPLFESRTPVEFGKGRSYHKRFSDAWRQEHANAALIVAAVNALPALIARVEELEGALGGSLSDREQQAFVEGIRSARDTVISLTCSVDLDPSTRAIIAQVLSSCAERAKKPAFGLERWMPIQTAPETVFNFEAVDLWVSVPASPRSMGISDAWRVPDCWKKDGSGPWCHMHRGEETELRQDIITHWMPIPDAPSAALKGGEA